MTGLESLGEIAVVDEYAMGLGYTWLLCFNDLYEDDFSLFPSGERAGRTYDLMEKV